MIIKKWYYLLAITAFGVVIFFILIEPSGNIVSNLHFILAGTFSMFPEVNLSFEKPAESNVSSLDIHRNQEQKLMDAEVLIYERNESIPDRYKRNITIIPVSEMDFRDYPELERTMLDVKDDPPLTEGNQSHYLTGFQANLSDYEHWLLVSICRDKSRHDCYEDLPVFEYNGRYYDISVAFF